MKRLSRNFLAVVGSDVARRILGFLAVAYLARKIGSDGFGAINIGFTVLSYALIVSSAGLHSYGVRAIARREQGDVVHSIISIRLVSGLVAFVVVLAIAAFITNTTTAALMVLFALSLFPNAFFVDWYFQGKERLEIVGIGRFAAGLTYLILIVLLVRSMADILMVAVASIAGDVVATTVMYIVYRTESGGRFRLTTSGWRSMVRQSLPLGTGYVIGTVTANLPVIVLGIIASNQDVGVFSAASKLVFFLLMLDRVLATLLLPASSRLHAYSPDLLASTLSTALKWILLAALPVCLGGTILAGRIMPLVFPGEDFAGSIDVFRILVWFFLATALHTVYTAGLIAVGDEKAYGRTMIVSGFVYGTAVIVCTMLFGVPGAAAAVVVSEFATFLLMRKQFEQHVRLHFPASSINAVVAAIGMTGVILVLPPINVFLIVVVGAIAYTILLFATRALTVNEVTALLRRV